MQGHIHSDTNYPIAQQYALTQARLQIEYLRRLYGQATDALGQTDSSTARQFGIETFRQIFTPDAQIRVTGSTTPLSATGPDGWVDVVTNALKDYESTQHLIGTQVVVFENVTFEQDQIVAAEARLSSYLQAWHVWPDRKLRLVMGTYIDHVRWIPQHGWQIFDMTLQHTSTEHRMLGDLN